MECAVYDTYVKRKDGKTMHFDVVVEANTPHEKAIEYGKQYLASVGQEGQKMTQEECQFIYYFHWKSFQGSLVCIGRGHKRSDSFLI
jgi:Domain of unknown function (DUF2024)